MKLDDAAIDRLRELGAADDMLKWLEHPDAVRRLLDKQTFWSERDTCLACGADASDAHARECDIANAIFALGHHEAERAMLLAWIEAEAEDIRREAPRPELPPQRINVVASPLVKDGEMYVMSDAFNALPEETRRRFPYVDLSGARKPK